MRPFQGKLLIGGMTLKDLVGVIEDEIGGEDNAVWTGRFTLSASKRLLLEPGRPYRLQLNDGWAAQVVVSNMDECNHRGELVVEFQGESPLVRECVIP